MATGAAKRETRARIALSIRFPGEPFTKSVLTGAHSDLCLLPRQRLRRIARAARQPNDKTTSYTGVNILAQFGLLYVGEPQFSGSEEEAKAHQQRYFAWLDGLGDAVVNRGDALWPAHTRRRQWRFQRSARRSAHRINHRRSRRHGRRHRVCQELAPILRLPHSTLCRSFKCKHLRRPSLSLPQWQAPAGCPAPQATFLVPSAEGRYTPSQYSPSILRQ